MWHRRQNTWFVKVDNGVVGWVSGGELIDGCDVVSALIFAPTPDAVEQRMEQIGLWSPYTMPKFYKHGRSACD